MKKLSLIAIFTFTLWKGSYSQCNSQDVTITCKTLKAFMEKELANKNLKKVLSFYLAFENIDNVCPASPQYKEFMNNVIKSYRVEIEPLKLTLGNSKAGQNDEDNRAKQFKSSMPKIVSITD